uniref:Uncharacterized protein n=1 Tax=Anguilla anguilla TaxID=7936 RepID=A0A0E9SYI0_ANGAN
MSTVSTSWPGTAPVAFVSLNLCGGGWKV